MKLKIGKRVKDMETRLTVKQMILNVIDDSPRGYASVLAKIAGYSSGSAFTKVLNKKEKEFDKFQGFLDVVYFLWKKDATKIICQYSTEIDVNKKTSRLMLEWMASNRQFEAFKILLNKMKLSTNNESLEWKKVYSIMYDYQTNFPNLDHDVLIKRITKTRTCIDELSVILKIMKIYQYHLKGEHHMTKLLSCELETEIEDLENEYIKERYIVRLSEIMSNVYLRVFNNSETARRFTDNILDSNAGLGFKGFANFVKGYSYLFTSYEKSLKYLTMSIEIYKSMERDAVVKDLEEKVEFLNLYWDKQTNNECFYVKNYMFMNVKKGINICNLLLEHREKIDEPTYLFLKGLNEKNNDILMESLIKYIKKGDCFLANLPKIELIKNGYNTFLLDEIISIKAA
jgi:hypothetical protein